MAATDATPYPIKNQAFRLHYRINAASNDNPITGGLTDKAGRVSKDGGSFASSTNTPVEIGTSGYGYIDLTASEMNADALIVEVTASNSGAVTFSREIVPFDSEPVTSSSGIASAVWAGGSLTENTGSITGMDDLIVRMAGYLLNHKVDNGTALTVYHRGSTSSVWMTRTVGAVGSGISATTTVTELQ